MDLPTLEQLTGLQAQHALIGFYDSLPARLWPGGHKPSTAELEAASDDLQDAATGQTAEAVQALLGEGNEPLKGEAARALLRRFHQADDGRPLVEQAIARAQHPDMALPVLIGVFVVALAVMPRIDYAKEDGKAKIQVTWDPSKNAGDLVAKLTDLVKALPSILFKAPK